MDKGVRSTHCPSVSPEEQREHLFHPLLNPLIVSQVLSYLHHLENIKNCRLVCRLWNEEATPYFQQLSQIRVPTEPHELPLFVAIVNAFKIIDCKNIVYRNYIVEDMHLDSTEDGCIEIEDFESFWKIFGYSIRCLVFQNVSFYDHHDVQDVIMDCRNLESLTFRNCSCNWSWNKQEVESMSGGAVTFCTPKNRKLKTLHMYLIKGQTNIPFHWNMMFYLCPNIKDLVLYNASPDQTLNLFRTIKYNRERRGQFQFQLEKLNIFHGEYAHSHDEFITEAQSLLFSLNFPLKELHIDTGFVSTEINSQTIWEKYHLSLEKVNIYSGQSGHLVNPFGVAGVSFLKIKVLQITGDTVQNLNFLSQLPVLEKLSILRSNASPRFHTELMKNTNDSIMNVSKNLTYLNIQYHITHSDVNKLVEMFDPGDSTRVHMKEIHLYLTDSSFQLICDNWKTLEVLEIYGRELTDYGLLGLTSSYDARTSLWLDKEELEEQLEDLGRPRSPNITNLKCLRKFIMKNRLCELTDMAVIHGLQLLKNLCHVEMCGLLTRLGWKMLYDIPQIETLIPIENKNKKCNYSRFTLRENVKINAVV